MRTTLTTPNDLPSVGTALPEPSFRLVWLSDRAVYKVNKPNIDTTDCYTPDVVRALVSERDELASRVRELEGALCQISDMTYDSWTNGAIAKQIADAALNASKEQP